MKIDKNLVLEMEDKFHEKNVRDLIRLVHDNSYQKLKDHLMDKVDSDKPLNEDEIHVIELILRIANFIYTNSGMDTGLTDSEYDALISKYNDVGDRALSITEEKTDHGKFHHTYKSLRGTLDKIYKITDEDKVKNKSQATLEQWVKSTSSKLGGKYDLWNEEVVVMPKFDGVSCIFECGEDGSVYKALTRGDMDNDEATDIWPIFKDCEYVFKPPFKDGFSYGVKTELMITNEDLQKINSMITKPFKNSRSAVSSLINSIHPRKDFVKLIKPIQLRYSRIVDGVETKQKLAPAVYDFPVLKTKLKNIDEIHEFAFANKNTFSSTFDGYLRCDGAVIQFTNDDIQDKLGRENNRNKFEVAFKYTEEVGYSEVKDVHFNIGATGKASVVVEFKPIKMKGNTVSRASLGSIGIFNKYKLHKGDIIKIYYDIVPYATFDEDDPSCIRGDGKKLKLPKVCPDCGEKLVLKSSSNADNFDENDLDVYLACENKNCPSRVKGKILNYCKRMDIHYIGDSTIDVLFDNKIVTSIKDLYDLDKNRNKLKKLAGYGDKKIDNIINDIISHNTCTASVLFGSIGIESLSIAKFKALFKVFKYEDVLNTIIENDLDFCIKFFDTVPGFKKKTITKLYDGINENKDLLKFLLSHLNVLQDVFNDNVLYHVAFTKIRDKELENWINEHSGVVDPRFKKNETDLVIVPSLWVTSNTTEAAKKKGVPLVEINNAVNYITQHYLKK